jgi:hypothetical protein
MEPKGVPAMLKPSLCCKRQWIRQKIIRLKILVRITKKIILNAELFKGTGFVEAKPKSMRVNR